MLIIGWCFMVVMFVLQESRSVRPAWYPIFVSIPWKIYNRRRHINFILVFLGAGLGGALRYGLSNSIYNVVGRHFPYGTLVVNASGSFLMGLLFILVLNQVSEFTPHLRSFLLVGFLGGYTTFSTFSLETLHLFERGAWMGGICNIIANVTLCMLLTWVGAQLGRQWWFR